MYRESHIRFDSPFKTDENGAIHAQARIARIGVQKYIINNRLVRELRREEDVKASVESFQNKPLTLNHPRIPVNAANADSYVKGFITNVRYEDGWMIADVHITHQDAIDAAKSSHRQFSNGYSTIVKNESGMWKDELGVMGSVGAVYEYDVVQTNIVGNHVALVERARAGSDATFTTDSDDDDIIIINCDEEESTLDTNTRLNMKFKHKDMEYEIEGKDAKAVVDLIHSMEKKNKDMEHQGKSLKEEKDSLEASLNTAEGKIDGLTLKIDSLEKDLESKTHLDSDEVAQEAKGRAEVWNLIADSVDQEPDYTMSVLDSQKLYLTKVAPQFAEKIEKGDAGYIAGLWDAKKPTKKSDSQKELEVLTAPSISKVFTAKSDSDVEAAFEKARLNAIR